MPSVLAFGVAVFLAVALPAAAQSRSASRTGATPPSISRTADPLPPSAARRHWTRFALGFGSSILLHEMAHVAASYAEGAHPSFGFDKGRPTIYSGIDAALDPHRQFIFSSAGLTVQMLLDEAVLDVPHLRGSSFERGVLAGGIGSVIFYTTIGRRASVSDITFMSRTSSLSITEVSLIYGAVAGLHTVRIWRDPHYAHFFAAPSGDGGLALGVRILTH